jgi:hypothetical protein
MTRFFEEHDAPGEAIAFLGPEEVAGVEEVAEGEGELEEEVGSYDCC